MSCPSHLYFTLQDVCSENYKKKCYIEYTRTAVTETLEKCIIPRERLCSPPQYGQVIFIFKKLKMIKII